MTDGSFRKTSLDASAAFQAIPSDVWVWGLVPALEPGETLPLRGLNREWRSIITHDDIWLAKLTALALQYPSLSQLDQGSGETVFSWFWRCVRAIGSGDALARRHKRGEYPYLQLYGAVDGYLFTPFAEMRFPIEHGVIAELVELMARSGKYADPAFDATAIFRGAPPGIAVDGSFRHIHKTLKRKVSMLTTDLRDLPQMLAKLYAPRAAHTPRATVAVMTGAKDTYNAMKEAFGPLLTACSEMNRRHTEVHLPWAGRKSVV